MTTSEEPREPDVVDTVLGTLDHYLDRFHDTVLRPIFLVGRSVAFGFLVVAFGLVAVTALLIGLVRILNVYAFAGKEYITYFVLGALFVITGLIVWRQRKPVPLRK
ncbi:MAG: hypothetical protein KJS64_07730 [Acidobacteria bacterium]|nr:hypothetical protein [Acidobacteriota bacterium]